MKDLLCKIKLLKRMEQEMKKILAAVIACALIAATAIMGGCSNKENNQTASSQMTATEGSKSAEISTQANTTAKTQATEQATEVSFNPDNLPIEGSWTLISLREDGKEKDIGDAADKYTFNDDGTFSLERADGKTITGKYIVSGVTVKCARDDNAGITELEYSEYDGDENLFSASEDEKTLYTFAR